MTAVCCISCLIHDDVWQGMDLIESLNHVGFNAYLKQYHNTICGRHPIGVLLAVSPVAVITNVISIRNGCGLIYLLLSHRTTDHMFRCMTNQNNVYDYGNLSFIIPIAPCGRLGCKNRPRSISRCRKRRWNQAVPVSLVCAESAIKQQWTNHDNPYINSVLWSAPDFKTGI